MGIFKKLFGKKTDDIYAPMAGKAGPITQVPDATFAEGMLGNGIAIDWTTMIADYLIAYALLGFGAGLMAGKKNAMVKGTLLGGALRFVAHFVVGAVVWGKWMPDSYFGMTMTNEWFYSFLYNAPYVVLCVLICIVLILLLNKPLGKYFRAEDLNA